MKSVLITGANGFVGRHLLERGLSEGYKVYAAVRKTSNVSTIEHLDVTILRLDYQLYASLNSVLSEHGPFDYVVHNAGVTEAIDLDDYRKGNVEVTSNLIKALKGDLVKSNFIYVSSLAARGPNYQGKDDPISDYGISKAEAESVVKSSGTNYVIVRPTAVYGSGDAAFFELVKLMKNGVSLSMGSRDQKLTFIHGYDLAKLIYKASPFTGKTFYGHDGAIKGQQELLNAIRSGLGKKRTIRIHIPAGLVRNISLLVNLFYNWVLGKSWHYNPPKIRELLATDWTIHTSEDQRLLEFEPTYTLESGFEEAIHYYKEKNWL